MTAPLKPGTRAALLLLHDHGPLHVSTGRREHNVGWRYISPASARALESRGLAFWGNDSNARLSPAGRELAAQLAEERAAEQKHQEAERQAARAEGLPSAPRLTLIQGDQA